MTVVTVVVAAAAPLVHRRSRTATATDPSCLLIGAV